MSLWTPALLGLLLLAGPIAWAYLRRAQPRQVPVGSLVLLRALAGVPARRRRLDRLLSLLLVLAALLLLTVGVAFQPAPPARPVVVVVDHSASMGATGPAGASRLDASRAALDDWLRDWSEAPVTVLATPPLRTLVAETRDHGAVREALEALAPAGAQQDPSPALRAWCGGDRPPTVLLLSDGLTLDPTLGCPVERPDLGEAEANAGIVALTARPVDGLGLVEVQAELRGAPDGLTLSVDGGAPGAVPASPSTIAWLDLPAGGALTLALPADAMPQDDVARVTIPGGAAVEAVLVTDQPEGFAALALRAHPRVDLTVVAPGAPAPAADLLVLEGLPARPLPVARRTLALGIDPADLGLSAGPRVRRPALSADRPVDPLLRWTRMDDLFIERSWTLRLPPGASPLLNAEEGVLALRAPRPDGAALVAFGFSLTESDLAMRAAWANLVANLVAEASEGAEVLPGAGLLSALESEATLPAGDGLAGRPLALLFRLAGLLAFGLLGAETLLEARRRRRHG